MNQVSPTNTLKVKFPQLYGDIAQMSDAIKLFLSDNAIEGQLSAHWPIFTAACVLAVRLPAPGAILKFTRSKAYLIAAQDELGAVMIEPEKFKAIERTIDGIVEALKAEIEKDKNEHATDTHRPC
jgi:hypothetical protein